MDATLKVAEVKPARGVAWLAQGFNLFRLRPLAWIGLCTGWIVITFGLLIIPLIGGAIASFLQPVFFASFAITAFRQLAGERVAMGDLFLGFRRNARALVYLGALLLLAEVAIFVVMALLGLPMTAEGEKAFTMAEYIKALDGKEWILAVGFVLTIVVKGALWFAPPLIAFHDMSTMHAVRWSIYAALANLGAMLGYGAVLLGLFILGMVPWGLGLLVVIPVMVTSAYFGYREVFEMPTATAPAAPEPPPV